MPDLHDLLRRAELGDLTVVPALTEWPRNPWTLLPQPFREGLDRLAARHGWGALLARLDAGSAAGLARDGSTPGRRMLGVELLHASGEDVSAALTDPTREVARIAYDLIAGSPASPPDGPLWELARSDGPGAPWAISALHRRGRDVGELARRAPRVPLPGVPDAVRAALVVALVPGGYSTDPRYLVEAAALGATLRGEDGLDWDDPALPDEAALALLDAGVDASEPVPVGTDVGVGYGNYRVIHVGDGRVDVSAEGRFVRLHDLGPDVADTLVGAGFLVIDEKLGRTWVTGLHVNTVHGSVDTVGGLLFEFVPDE